MFQSAICYSEGQYYKIKYKFVRYKHTKTKACCKNISYSLTCSFIFLIFSFVAIQNFDLMFHPTNLMN